jgi:predicted AlkP superfamily phosphohydrolase/phosphomutase
MRGEYTPWIRLEFRTALGARVTGTARFLLKETAPEVTLYVSPINIDPDRPALPISHPRHYAVYLANLLGPYATLGMPEDTWALNEGVLDEAAFLKQVELAHQEREAMFRHALETTRRGVVACVFDAADRVQHMFYRYLDPRHPAFGSASPHAGAIEETYRRMDRLVGTALGCGGSDTVLFVLSDHGFRAFRRGVNLNSWLRQNGYLALEDGASAGASYFRGVDWSRTRAYALGLAGIYLNLKGREARGVVEPGAQAQALKRELAAKLTGLRDEEQNEIAIRRVYVTDTLYRGPYLDGGPDLIVGFNDGYRASWGAALGQVTDRVIEDNPKAWSGDHSVDPALVPGVLFSNRRIDAEDPGLEDLAPTALALFGVEPPEWMEGKPVFHFTGEAAKS